MSQETLDQVKKREYIVVSDRMDVVFANDELMYDQVGLKFHIKGVNADGNETKEQESEYKIYFKIEDGTTVRIKQIEEPESNKNRYHFEMKSTNPESMERIKSSLEDCIGEELQDVTA